MSDTDFDVEDGLDPMERIMENRLAEAQARARLTSRTRCEECDEAIPEARREAVPGVRLCVYCQTHADARGATIAARPFFDD